MTFDDLRVREFDRAECAQCGKSLVEDAAFCGACGAPVEGREARPEATASIDSNRPRWWLVGSIALVIAGGVGASLVFGDSGGSADGRALTVPCSPSFTEAVVAQSDGVSTFYDAPVCFDNGWAAVAGGAGNSPFVLAYADSSDASSSLGILFTPEFGTLITDLVDEGVPEGTAIAMADALYPGSLQGVSDGGRSVDRSDATAVGEAFFAAWTAGDRATMAALAAESFKDRSQELQIIPPGAVRCGLHGDGETIQCDTSALTDSGTPIGHYVLIRAQNDGDYAVDWAARTTD